MGMLSKFGGGAAGLVGGVLGGSILHSIGDAIAGSPSEAVAKERVAPLFNKAVNDLMAGGMSFKDAQEQAATAVQGHVQEEMSKSNMPAWLGLALDLGGMFLGAGVAGKVAGKIAGKAGFGAAAGIEAKAAATADAAVIDPLKAKAAGAVAEGSGNAAEGAALKSHGPFPPAMGNKPAPNMKPVDRDVESTEIPGAPDELERSLIVSPSRFTGGASPMTDADFAAYGARQSAKEMAQRSSQGANRFAQSTTGNGPFPALGDAAFTKKTQMEGMFGNRTAATSGSRPAYHARDGIPSDVGQDDIDSVIFRLVNGQR